MTGAALRPGGRVAIINSRLGVRSGASFQRQLLVEGVSDRGGLTLTGGGYPVETGISDGDGITVSGQVLSASGEPVAGVPVTLTMHEHAGDRCEPSDVPVSQVMSGPDGTFQFDYVMSVLRGGYTVSATDIRGVDPLIRDLLLATSDPSYADLERINALIEAQGLEIEGENAEAFLDVDRTFFRDQVGLTSSRIGSTVPVTLQFRGRGTVEGTVYLSDGVTPVAGQVVTLYPDLDAEDPVLRVRTDAEGRFVHHAVALGNFTLLTESSLGVALQNGRLDKVNARVTVDLVLADPSARPTGNLEGVIYESDGVTPHPGGWVVIEDGPWTKASGSGAFAFEGLPTGDYRLTAVSEDRVQVGRRSVQVNSGTTQFAPIVLQGFSEVRGIVVRASGQPAAGVLVGAPGGTTTTDAAGAFVLARVPMGSQTIEAFQDAATTPNVEVSRLGQTRITVTPGTNYARIELESVGRIQGTVRDAAGALQPNVRVALPTDGGFLWKDADASGYFELDRLSLSDHLIVAPAPAVLDVEGAVEDLLGAIRNPGSVSADTPEILDALRRIGMAASGERPESETGDFGFIRRTLEFDDQ
ncbi:MAG: hypothetical protein AAFU79_25025, partial [Myxococcota bacterium]